MNVLHIADVNAQDNIKISDPEKLVNNIELERVYSSNGIIIMISRFFSSMSIKFPI